MAAAVAGANRLTLLQIERYGLEAAVRLVEVLPGLLGLVDVRVRVDRPHRVSSAFHTISRRSNDTPSQTYQIGFTTNPLSSAGPRMIGLAGLNTMSRPRYRMTSRAADRSPRYPSARGSRPEPTISHETMSSASPA